MDMNKSLKDNKLWQDVEIGYSGRYRYHWEGKWVYPNPGHKLPFEMDRETFEKLPIQKPADSLLDDIKVAARNLATEADQYACGEGDRGRLEEALEAVYKLTAPDYGE